ncbi:MAG: flagellar basal body P-ring formation protein FlgA [Magnetovibrio sp.]|nr:flagellar basal body P-ring formation protein FlgA [Magnetovibrio sp.]
MRLLTLLMSLTLLLSAPTWAAGDKSQNGATVDVIDFITLNDRVVIEDGVIRLGDVFRGSSKYANRVIAYAPRPGGRSVFDARWLKRVARAFKLNWRPASSAERIIVERASQLVRKDEIEALLHERLVAEGGDLSSRAKLSNRSFVLHLPVGEDYLLDIEQMSFDQSTGRFSAILAWGTGKDERRRVTGRLERLIEVPVLSQRKMGGDIIQKSDLKWIEVTEKRLARNAIIDASRLIGMAAKRSIGAGKAISASDIRRPKVVSKGQIVTMVLVTPIMRLTTKGKALQAGGTGDTIRISNTQTSTVVEGVITGPGQVRVDTAINLAMR